MRKVTRTPSSQDMQNLVSDVTVQCWSLSNNNEAAGTPFEDFLPYMALYTENKKAHSFAKLKARFCDFKMSFWMILDNCIQNPCTLLSPESEFTSTKSQTKFVSSSHEIDSNALDVRIDCLEVVVTPLIENVLGGLFKLYYEKVRPIFTRGPNNSLLSGLVLSCSLTNC